MHLVFKEILKINDMPRGVKISVEIKQLIINAYSRGDRQSDIARRFEVKKSAVWAIIKRYERTGSIEHKPKSGRPKKMSNKSVRMLKRISSINPFMSSNQLKVELETSGMCSVSSRTIRRRLVEEKLFSRRPAKKPLLSKKNRLARLEFARQHIHWTKDDWKRVCWSDESKFNLLNSDGIQFVRRPVGHRLDPKYTKPTVKHGGGSVIVWGCFSGFGMGPLHNIIGIMDRFMYRDILQNVMLPHVEDTLPLRFKFQQDNDPKHSSKLVKKFFTDEQIPVLKWPSQSPDLNPIENLWEILDRSVRTRTYSNKGDLFASLQEKWSNLDMGIVDKLIESMPRRCQAVIDNKGYFTKY